MKWRVCFLGSPEFAVPSLKFIKESPHFELVGVVTQPDRPAGRNLVLKPTAVKAFCLENNINFINPEKISSEDGLNWVSGLNADVAVVVAFGQILSERFLNLFKFGAVNLHGSLLPRWRGAAPIQRAMEAGDLETGLSLQKIVKALDAGDILGERKIAISQEINALEMLEKLSHFGPELLKEELIKYLKGELVPRPQNSELVTIAPKILKTECEINFSMSSNQIHNKVRALTMGPGAFTFFRNQRLKVIKTKVMSDTSFNKNFGHINSLSPLVVSCGVGQLELLEVQPESKSKMQANVFVKSTDLKLQERLGKHEN